MSKKLLPLALLVALILPTVASVNPISPTQENLVLANMNNVGPNGEDDLQGEWRFQNEIHRLYFRDGLVMDHQPRSTCNQCGASYSLIYDPTPVVGVESVDFAYGMVPNDFTLTQLGTKLWLGSNEPTSVRVQLLDGTTPIPDAFVDVPLGSTLPYDIQVPQLGGDLLLGMNVVNNQAFFNPPLEITAGTDLNVRIGVTPGQESFLSQIEFGYNYPTHEAEVILIGEVSHTNTWLETSGGVTTNTFPKAATAPPEDRTIEVNSVHLSGLGSDSFQLAGRFGGHRQQITVTGPDMTLDAEDRTPDDVVLFQSGGPVGDWSMFPPNPRTQFGAADGIMYNVWNLGYAANYKGEGVHKITLSADGQNWKETYLFTIGGGILNIDATPFESLAKTVLEGETTQFQLRVTNAGSTQDTALLSVPANLDGWKASVAPNNFALSPGGSQDVTVTIEPPANAIATDFKTFRVDAVSAVSSQSDNVDLTVLLTDVASHGLDVLSTSTGIKVAPGQSRTIPLVIQNLGNIAEPTTVSTTGTPVGWTTLVNPTNIELKAKTQNVALMTVSAPPTAKAGDAFVVNVRATAVADNLINDVLQIPVEVFFEDGMQFGVLSGASAAGGSTLVRSTIAELEAVFGQDAGIGTAHKLRDEGPDGNSREVQEIGGLPTFTDCQVTGPGFSCSGPYDGDVDPDRDHDQATLYRLVIRNDGDRADTFDIFSRWETGRSSLGYRDLDGCEEPSDNGGGTDNLNDGWRFRIFDPYSGSTIRDLPGPGQGTKQGNAWLNGINGGIQTIQGQAPLTVDVPAQSTRYVYAELGWWVPDPSTDSCDTIQSLNGARAGDPAPGATVELTAISRNNPINQATTWINAEHRQSASLQRLASQVYTGQVNDVIVHMDEDVLTTPKAQQGIAKQVMNEGNAAARTTTYWLRATNAGNEMDTIRLSVPSNSDGWTFDLDRAGFKLHEDLFSTPTIQGHGSGAKTATCGNVATLNAGSSLERRYVDCTMGSFDEVVYPVKVTAPVGADIGSKKVIPAAATSLDSLVNAAGGGVIERSVLLTTQATGTFAFQVLTDAVLGTVDVEVHPGGEVLVPFTIDNVGTQGDSFNVDLAVEPSEDGWTGFFSSLNPVFVPGNTQHEAYLAISAPDTATINDVQNYRIKVQSLDSIEKLTRIINVDAKVVADSTVLEASGDPPEVLSLIGAQADIPVRATRLSGAALDVEFRLDTNKLPTGWTVIGDTTKTADFDLTGAAGATFSVQVPSNAIGSSRGVLHFVAEDSNGNLDAFQVVVSLDASSFGLLLRDPNNFSATNIESRIVSGSTTTIPVRVENLGAGVDSVDLSTSTLPAGWTVTFAEDPVALQPRQAKEILVTVGAPAGLAAGQGIDIVLTGTSVSDNSRTSSITLKMSTGSSLLDILRPQDHIKFVAPEETATYVMRVTNNGTIRDELDFGASFSPAYEDLVNARITPASAILAPGESVQVSMAIDVPRGILPNALIPVTFEATSNGPFLNAFGSALVETRVLNHRTQDIDLDGFMEYAIDRNRDGGDGFEDFADPEPTGKVSSSIDMSQFLTPAAIEDWTALVTENGTTFEVFTFQFDLTGDDRIDHFVDENQDNLPDTFWDPNTGGRDALETTFDVTQDGVREYFVDVNSDNLLDVWYDVTTGQVGNLLKVDVDGDGTVDFVVDLDGDGVHDDGEPVLFGKDGKITKITQSLDVNGDGRPDLVVDEDGDGIPDYFVPAGKTRGVRIVLEDVNGDGVEDWTYDANGDGRRDSFYDPVTGKTGSIDTGSEFIDGLARYWYVPTLFALVTVLFVVLVVVTRR